MELLDELEKLQQELEKRARHKGEECKILDIMYYDNIAFDELEAQEVPIFLVEKEVNGEIKKELQAANTVIADIGEDNQIHMRKEFFDKELIILMRLRNTTPISLRELEEREMERQQNRNTNQSSKTEKSVKEDKEIKDDDLEEINQTPSQNKNAKDIEIDLDKKITDKKTFADLVPEVKQKNIVAIKVRRLDATRFEFYGETQEGEKVEIESLKTVEGTNPIKDITKVEKEGEVKEDQVYYMCQITNGTNEQNGNEGFCVDIKGGIPEISYYRRSMDNEYTSVPVNLRNTNQKQTSKEVQEYAEKARNPEVSDNIKKANSRLEEQEKTTLENIDDDTHNDIPEARRRI